MEFYPSKNNNRLNAQPFYPDLITGKAMINPFYPVMVSSLSKILCDSGAFQRNGTTKHKKADTAEIALQRQLGLEATIEERHGREWHYEALVTLDQVLGVDEFIVEGKQVKQRGTEETARPAIKFTLESAEYYASQRSKIRGNIIFACQGATPEQYVNECVTPMLDIMQKGDWLGLGGFCIIGKVPSLKPLFYATLERCIPLAKRKGITRFHILGVTAPDAILIATSIAKRFKVKISTDSSSIEVNSVMGREFDATAGRWVKLYERDQKYVDYHPTDLSHSNIREYNAWCNYLKEKDITSITHEDYTARATHKVTELLATPKHIKPCRSNHYAR